MKHTQSKFWIESISGKRIDLRRPNAKNIDITDIACALSKTARFNGHTKGLRSVAAHCLDVERVLREYGASVPVRLKGLLHDAAEAYCHDFASPWKSLLPAYRKYEANMFIAVMKGLGLEELLHLSKEDDAQIKLADSILLITERRDFKAKTNWHYHNTHCAVDVQPLDRKLKQMGWRQAERKFLKAYHRLTSLLEK